MPQYSPRLISDILLPTAGSLLSMDTFPATGTLNQVIFIHGQTPASNNGLYRWDGAAWDNTANVESTGSAWITDEFIDFAGSSVTLTNTPTNSTDEMLVFRNGVLEENSGYSLAGLTLTFTLPNTSGLEDIVVFYKT